MRVVVLFAAVFSAFAASQAAHASVIRYSMTFYDEEDNFFGRGSYTVDTDIVIDLDDYCYSVCRLLAGDHDFPSYSPIQNLSLDFEYRGPLWDFGSGLVTACKPPARNCPTFPNLSPGWIASNFSGTFAIFHDYSVYLVTVPGEPDGIFTGRVEISQMPVPLPAAFPLFLFGLAGLGALRMKYGCRRSPAGIANQ